MDLIGYNGGYNLFRYVKNNPSRLLDPLGLKCCNKERIKQSIKKCMGNALAKFRRCLIYANIFAGLCLSPCAYLGSFAFPCAIGCAMTYAGFVASCGAIYMADRLACTQIKCSED